MSKKLYVFFALLLACSMALSACGAPAATEAPVVEAPVKPEVVVTEAPVAELDLPALFTDFWASIPADKGFGSVGAAKLNEELADKAPFLLDVREDAEVEKDGYIEGAVHIPVRDLLNNLDKLPGLDDPIVVYCASGHRGGYTLMALRMLGYTNVRNLGGGMGAWKKAELPVVTGSLPPAPEALGTPIVEDQALFTTLNGFFTSMPDSFYATKADVLATDLAEKAPFLLDVRTQAEVDKDGYIEGGVHIPFSDFLTSLDQLPAEKDAPIVVYCASGHRGSMAAMALRLMGYTDVANLGGGIGAWKGANLPVAGWVDWATVMGEFVAGLPADQGFYSTSADKLNVALAEGPVFIVDVREASEVEATGHIAGSIHIPARDLLKNLDKLPGKDEKIVVTCASGHRGGFAMMALRLLGYTDVVNLGGGIGAWSKASLPLEAGLPAEAPVLGAPEVDAARLTALDAYFSALPDSFNVIKAADLNVELGNTPAPFVLDIRTEAEKTADGYIEGSVFIPINELTANLVQLPTDKAAPIVVLCKSGHRGGMAMMYLNFLGYTNVRNLGGGMGAWIAAELPVTK